jgi:subtilisin family serine protease
MLMIMLVMFCICSASESDKAGNIDYVAYFSSLGPTYDNRIKPDIVAPGAGLDSVQAAKQGSNAKTCETTLKQGTSMATPAVAGAAALLKQYFQDQEGKFWTKACSPSSDSFCNALTPSGMLLKALLIHSGEPMSLYHGDKSKDVSLSTKGEPDVYQGYGRVQLSNVIPLPGQTNFQLTVRDLVDVQEKTAVTHYFEVTDSSQPLVVTISWYDPPAVSGASKALMNDLDLVLVLPGGKGKVYGNFGKKRDTVNNNERIFIKKPTKGTYAVNVEANSLPVAGHQRFAFVLSYAAGGPVSTKKITEHLLEQLQQKEKLVPVVVVEEFPQELVDEKQQQKSLKEHLSAGVGKAWAHVRDFFMRVD